MSPSRTTTSSFICNAMHIPMPWESNAKIDVYEFSAAMG